MALVPRALSALAAAVVFACSSNAADDNDWKGDPDLGTNIVSAAVFDGQLWLTGEPGDKDLGGALVSYRLSDGTRTLRIARNVVGIVKPPGHMLALVAADAHHFSLEEWKNGAFIVRASVELAAAPTLFTLIGGKPATVSPTGIELFDGHAWHAIAADLTPPGQIHRPPSAAGATASGRYIYVGYNYGEWGGGLTRIDAESGAVKPIDFKGRWASNINAVIPDPADTDCVLVALGLIHFDSLGEIARVCGDTLTHVFAEPEGRYSDYGSKPSSSSPRRPAAIGPSATAPSIVSPARTRRNAIRWAAFANGTASCSATLPLARSWSSARSAVISRSMAARRWSRRSIKPPPDARPRVAAGAGCTPGSRHRGSPMRPAG